MNGILKWFNLQKGFGFIAGEDEIDYFVHITEFEQATAYADAKTEVKVSFETTRTDRGWQAIKVKVVGEEF